MTAGAPSPAPGSPVLLLSSSERVSRPAQHLLSSAGHAVTHVTTPLQARTWLRVHRADLAVVELDAGSPPAAEETMELVRSLQDRRGGPRVLVLTLAKGESQLRPLFERMHLLNFLTFGDDATIDPVELIATVSKILTGDIFGMERYLAPGAEIQEISVVDSQQKKDVVERLEAFARETGCHPREADAFSVAADEMVTNAVYNAPVDGNGRPRFASLSRKQRVTLEPHEAVTVRYGRDPHRLCLATSDPFGSLKPEVVQDYLSKCFGRGEGQIDEKEGGAGLGLYTVFNLVHHFVLNIAPGTRTEAIGLLEVSQSYRRFSTRAKAFNVFVREER